jgi:hypothetical protein
MKLAVATLLVASGASVSDTPSVYKDGWTYAEFYDAVVDCRSWLVFSAAQGYLAKGADAHVSAEMLRSDVVSLLPVFDIPAGAGCFCAVNEIAKTETYSQYVNVGDKAKRLDAIGAAVTKGPCAEPFKSSRAAVSSKDAMDALKLK